MVAEEQGEEYHIYIYIFREKERVRWKREREQYEGSYGSWESKKAGSMIGILPRYVKLGL